MAETTIEEIYKRIEHGYHMSPRNQIFEDVLALKAEVDRLKAENENLDETVECLQSENESLRNELGGIYARSLKETEHAN